MTFRELENSQAAFADSMKGEMSRRKADIAEAKGTLVKEKSVLADLREAVQRQEAKVAAAEDDLSRLLAPNKELPSERLKRGEASFADGASNFALDEEERFTKEPITFTSPLLPGTKSEQTVETSNIRAALEGEDETPPTSDKSASTTHGTGMLRSLDDDA